LNCIKHRAADRPERRYCRRRCGHSSGSPRSTRGHSEGVRRALGLAERMWSSPRAPSSSYVDGRESAGIAEALGPHSTGWGQFVERGPSPEGSFGKGRHLGCGGTHSSSRKGAGGGPSRDEAKARLGGEAPRKRSVARWERSIESATPAGALTGPRQEVSEAIGLGPSSPYARKRGERSWGSPGESRKIQSSP
jgi:hypothetical protein